MVPKGKSYTLLSLAVAENHPNIWNFTGLCQRLVPEACARGLCQGGTGWSDRAAAKLLLHGFFGISGPPSLNKPLAFIW